MPQVAQLVVVLVLALVLVLVVLQCGLLVLVLVVWVLGWEPAAMLVQIAVVEEAMAFRISCQ